MMIYINLNYLSLTIHSSLQCQQTKITFCISLEHLPQAMLSRAIRFAIVILASYTCFSRNVPKSKRRLTAEGSAKIYLRHKRSALNIRLFSRCLVTRVSGEKVDSSWRTMKVVFNPLVCNRVGSISNYKLEFMSLSLSKNRHLDSQAV